MNENFDQIVLSPSSRRKFCFYFPLTTLIVVGTVATALLASVVITEMDKGSAPGAYIMMIAGPSLFFVTLIFFTVSTLERLTIACSVPIMCEPAGSIFGGNGI